MNRPRRAFLDWPSPIPFAHRGDSHTAPENTLPAFAAAIEAGYHHLETDVHLSRDGAVVAFHDDVVDWVDDGRVRIADLTAAELAAVDLGHSLTRDGGWTFPHRGRCIGIPLLSDIREGAHFVASEIDGGGTLAVPHSAAAFVFEELLDRERDAGAEFAFEQVQGNVEPRGHSRTAHQVAVVDHAGIDGDRPGGVQKVHPQVMGHGMTAFQHSCHREDQTASADGGDGQTGLVPGLLQHRWERRLQGAAEPPWDRVLAIAIEVAVASGDTPRCSWHNDEVGSLRVQPGRGPQGQWT
jgi:hypothetical protein